MMESYATRNWKDLETDFNERNQMAPGAGATVFGIPLDKPGSDSQAFKHLAVTLHVIFVNLHVDL